jgi:ribosome-associated protein
MRTAPEAAARAIPVTEHLSSGTTPGTPSSAALLKDVLTWLDDAKSENIVTIDLAGKSSIGDFMVIASGRSDRHVGAIGEQLQRKLKEAGAGRVRIEGLSACDWVLIDTGDIIIHIFRPEVREFYKLEKMWSGERPGEETAH